MTLDALTAEELDRFRRIAYEEAELAVRRGALRIEEVDGSPSLRRPKVLKMPNTTLTDNGDGTLTYAAAGGGGGGSTVHGQGNHLPTKTTPNDPPDDEFAGGTLDAQWTAVAGTSGTVSLLETGNVSKYDLATRDGFLLLQAGNSGAQIVSLRQDYAVPDGSSIILAMSMGFDSSGATAAWTNNEFWGGLWLNDSDTDYDAGTYQGLFFDTDTGGLRILYYDGATIGSTPAAAMQGLGVTIYLRIARNGTAYTGFFSFDGATWIPMGISDNATAYNNVWIAFESKAASTDPVPIMAVDFIRLGNNALDPWA